MLTCVLSKLPAKHSVNLQVTRDIRKVELGEPVKLCNRKIYTYKAKKRFMVCVANGVKGTNMHTKCG